MTQYNFGVRWYQQALHKALVQRTHDRLIAIWHRRAGKDEIVLNAMRERSQIEVGTYWHCFPEQAQARKAIWNGVNGHTGKRRILEAFPEPLIKRMQDNDMFIELKNGSTFQLIGSDRYDSTVGSGPKGIAYSEWALSNPAAWAYHSPMIRESGGFAAFITTPRGNNHAKTMYDRAVSRPDVWFSQLLSIEETKTLSEEILEEALEEYQDLHGIDLGLSTFNQEYMCSFAGVMIGSYWGAEIDNAEKAGQMHLFDIDWDYPVHTSWDLGKHVNNPIWCFQVINGNPRIVDFYKPETEDLEDWCTWLTDKGYKGTDYVPWDIIQTDWGVKRTRRDRMKDCGRKPKGLKQVAVADGLTAGRETIKSAMFYKGDPKTDERAKRMALGIEGLKNYRREWDADLKTFKENPVKDWSEHIGSSFRYLGLSWRDAIVRKEKPAEKPELVYTAKANGSVIGNMNVKEAVDAMVKRRAGRR